MPKTTKEVSEIVTDDYQLRFSIRGAKNDCLQIFKTVKTIEEGDIDQKKTITKQVKIYDKETDGSIIEIFKQIHENEKSQTQITQTQITPNQITPDTKEQDKNKIEIIKALISMIDKVDNEIAQQYIDRLRSDPTFKRQENNKWHLIHRNYLKADFETLAKYPDNTTKQTLDYFDNEDILTIYAFDNIARISAEFTTSLENKEEELKKGLINLSYICNIAYILSKIKNEKIREDGKKILIAFRDLKYQKHLITI